MQATQKTNMLKRHPFFSVLLQFLWRLWRKQKEFHWKRNCEIQLWVMVWGILLSETSGHKYLDKMVFCLLYFILWRGLSPFCLQTLFLAVCSSRNIHWHAAISVSFVKNTLKCISSKCHLKLICYFLDVEWYWCKWLEDSTSIKY